MPCVRFCYSKLTLRENFAYFTLLLKFSFVLYSCNMRANKVTSVKNAYLKKCIVLGNSSSVFYPSWKMCTLIEIPFPCNLLGIWSLNAYVVLLKQRYFIIDYPLKNEPWILLFTLLGKQGYFWISEPCTIYDFWVYM